MKITTLPGMAVMTAALWLGACGDTSQPLTNSQNLPAPTGPAAAQAVTTEVSFDFDLSALLTTESSAQILNDRTVKALDANIMTGTLQAENLDTTEVETYPWTVNLDKSDLSNVQSLNTIALPPASYIFSIVLDRDNHQYAGSAVHTLVEDAADVVPMTIRPVLGDSQVDVSILESLVDFKFSYNDLASAGLSTPSMGISVDNGPEQVFLLDPATGLSEHMYLNLLPGNYDIALRLFEGNIQVGKSLPEQGSAVSVAAGLDVSMDIVPLYAEMALALAVEGDDAIVNVSVPAEVVDEAGGEGNLLAVMSVVGPDFPLQEIALSLTPDAAGYTASTILNDVMFGDMNFELTFSDATDLDELGNCVDSVVINSGATTVECKLTLRRRAVVGGSLLSTVGVNVFDVNGNAVQGAVVSVDGEEVAITNSAAFSTPGYSKLYLKPGERTIRAQSGISYGEAVYTSNPLSVDNLELVLDQSEGPVTLFTDDFNGNQEGSAAPTGYWFGCLAKGSYEGYVGNGKLFLGSRYNNTNNDWCWSTSALTEHSFTDSAITDAGGFVVSLDIASAAAQNSVITIGLGGEPGTDPSTFYPTETADVIISVRDNNVAISMYAGGVNTDNVSFPMPIPVAFMENLTVDVETASFAAGAPATLNIVLNGDSNLIPPVPFTWDGGGNHVEIRGSAGVAANGGGINYVEYEGISINPR